MSRMDLSYKFVETPVWGINLPHSFLNDLLATGYQFEGDLVLLVQTPFDTHYYCSMREFKANTNAEGGETVDIPRHLNQYLNLPDPDPDEHIYINVSKATLPRPHLLTLQAHNESFGLILNDPKVLLEELCSHMKVINSGMTIYLDTSHGPEAIDVVNIQSAEGELLPAGLVTECDVEIDFLETLESIALRARELELEKEREVAHQRALEAAQQRALELEKQKADSFVGVGHSLGGGVNNRTLDREARLAKLEESIKRATKK